MGKLESTIIGIVTGIISLAIIAVIFSKNADTPNVISSAGSALANVITAAVAPVDSSSTSTTPAGDFSSILGGAGGLGGISSVLSNPLGGTSGGGADNGLLSSFTGGF